MNHKELRHLRGACKVIFLDQFCLRPPVYAAGGASKKMFEPCKFESMESPDESRKTKSSRLTLHHSWWRGSNSSSGLSRPDEFGQTHFVDKRQLRKRQSPSACNYKRL